MIKKHFVLIKFCRSACIIGELSLLKQLQAFFERHTGDVQALRQLAEAEKEQALQPIRKLSSKLLVTELYNTIFHLLDQFSSSSAIKEVYTLLGYSFNPFIILSQ